MRILAVDIGGTKSAVGLCEVDATVKNVMGLTTLASRDYRSLLDMINNWQAQHPDLSFDAVGAGVAGPVVNGHVHLTNLGWDIDAASLASAIKKPVRLCNDMESHGWGILGLGPDQTVTLNNGKPAAGAKALIAAGTGLGEAIIGWNGLLHAPMPGEGGHASFSPTNELEDDLLKFLRQEYSGHVSWERVLGGFDGFRNLARFLANHHKTPLPGYLTALGDKPADWGAAIVGATDMFADSVLTLYATLYGREAANLALKCVPSGGVYIGGGIAPRILPKLQKHFMAAFTDKGRFRELLTGFPVHVITDPLNGLKGAALQTRGTPDCPPI
jgi:glucokinase